MSVELGTSKGGQIRISKITNEGKKFSVYLTDGELLSLYNKIRRQLND